MVPEAWIRLENAKPQRTPRPAAKKRNYYFGAFFADFASLRFQRAVEQAPSFKKRLRVQADYQTVGSRSEPYAAFARRENITTKTHRATRTMVPMISPGMPSKA
jgi:hypothetical protein